MNMKSIWKGAISFGLVNIPVKLYPATQQSTLKFQMVDKSDSGRIRYRRINENTGKEVSSENIGKAIVLTSDLTLPEGKIVSKPQDEKKPAEEEAEDISMEYRRGDTVILTASDFLKAEPERSKIIEVNHFVDEKEINSIYYENSYYIEPELHGEKAYALLREALQKSGKIGVGQFMLRNTATLALIKPVNEVLVLGRLHYAEEIRSTQGLSLPPKSLVKSNEIKMALMLINQYSEPFDIHKYRNEYVNSLLKTVRDRATGKETKVRKLKVKETDDLIKQLKASLARNRAS
jgi:DNA end-binding protein Ku